MENAAQNPHERYKVEKLYYEQRHLNSELKRRIWANRKRLRTETAVVERYTELVTVHRSVDKFYHAESGVDIMKLQAQKHVLSCLVRERQQEISKLQDELKLAVVVDVDEQLAAKSALEQRIAQLTQKLQTSAVNYRDPNERFLLRNSAIIEVEDTTIPTVQTLEKLFLEHATLHARIAEQMQLIEEFTFENKRFLEQFGLSRFMSSPDALAVHFASKWSARLQPALEAFLKQIYCEFEAEMPNANVLLFAALCWGWRAFGSSHPRIKRTNELRIHSATDEAAPLG